QFSTFAASCRRLLVNARCPEAAALGRRVKAATYGAAAGADTALTVGSVGPARASGVLARDGTTVALDVPQPGFHNLENAAAAVRRPTRAPAPPSSSWARAPPTCHAWPARSTPPSPLDLLVGLGTKQEEEPCPMRRSRWRSSPRTSAAWSPASICPSRWTSPRSSRCTTR